MKSLALIPYCPLPVDSGAKSIFIKHLTFLKGYGPCCITSAETRPVGAGWRDEYKQQLQNQGFTLRFREKKAIFGYLLAMSYAVFFKTFGMERAFGHSNPYHRNAFPADWWYAQTKSVNLAEIHYSYWAHLPCACPKVVIVHDLWSDIMWEGSRKETAELKKADLVVTLSSTDQQVLVERGLENVHWSPPCIEETSFPDSRHVAIVGSANRHNREGLKWLRQRRDKGVPLGVPVNCYGGIAGYIEKDDFFVAKGSYLDTLKPYAECGIVLMLTSSGTGTQIKGIEALASGRAIIARKGAMRGLPPEEKGWLEVETAEEMVELLRRVISDHSFRHKMMNQARTYYLRHLQKKNILQKLHEKYQEIRRD